VRNAVVSARAQSCVLLGLFARRSSTPVGQSTPRRPSSMAQAKSGWLADPSGCVAGLEPKWETACGTVLGTITREAPP
jgi:hypothetical protein